MSQSRTLPDRLVMSILQPRSFSSAATNWGVYNEPLAIQAYVAYKHEHGCDSLTVGRSGFLICESHPFLGATPDGTVYDPSNPQQPFGFVEVKCLYSHRDHTPAEACSSPGFCCNLKTHLDGNHTPTPKRTCLLCPSSRPNGSGRQTMVRLSNFYKKGDQCGEGVR